MYPHPTATFTTTTAQTSETVEYANATTRYPSIEELSFWHWCQNVLGIAAAPVEIRYFPYPPPSTLLVDWEDDLLETDNDETTASSSSSMETVWVRGLAATRDITKGEVLISIPIMALGSLSNLIARDAELAAALESFAVSHYPPTTMPSHRDAAAEEHLALLAVALLHQRRRGANATLAPYVELLWQAPLRQNLPFLWSAAQLQATATEGVRRVARSMRQEMRTLYERVVLDLVQQQAQVFGETVARDPVSGEWLFSYAMFQWAFAAVSSRHWQLPLFEEEEEPPTTTGTPKPKDLPVSDERRDPVPPADTPTQSWVTGGSASDATSAASSSSFSFGTIAATPFLAPLADLMNFGPPCTRVQFSPDTRTFDTIATCDLRSGQEVTFWYRRSGSDDSSCADVMMGVYGVTHPLIPPCPSPEEGRRQVATLQEKLHEAYHDILLLEEALESLEALLGLDDESESREEEEEEEEGGGEDGNSHGLRHETERKPEHTHGILRRTGSREF